MQQPSSTVWLFFALTYAISGLLQLPAVLALAGILDGTAARFMPLAGLGTFGPMLSALLLARFHSQGGGARALLAGLRPRGVSVPWLLLALFLPGALLVAGLAGYQLVSGNDPGPWLYPPRESQRVVAMLLIPFAEEIGWRGFALPRLVARHGAFSGSLRLGVAWAVWHVPMLALAGVPMSLFPHMVAFFVAGSVVFTWLWSRSGKSLLVAVLAHAGAHLNNSHLALPADELPFLVHTSAFVVLASALVVLDRSVFGPGPSTPSGHRSRWRSSCARPL